MTGRIVYAWRRAHVRAVGVLEPGARFFVGRRPAQWRAVVVPTILAGTMALTLGACHTAPTAPKDSITVTGFAERGASVALAFLRGGVPVAPASVAWSATPASAVTIVAGGIARFADTGSVTFTGQDGDASASITVDVKSPPVILFDQQDSGGLGNRDVYTVALDGVGLAQLTSGTSDNEQPVLANGSVVFTSFRDGYAALYTLPLSGGTETRIANIPAPSDQPSVSADGTTLAFISPLGGADHLWTSAIDGTNATAATGSAGFATAVEASPSWSTSDDTLVVVTTQFGNASLARLAVAEGVETPLTDGSSTDVDPSWSPDGSTIAFISTRDGDVRDFHLHRRDGSDQAALAHPGQRGGSRLAPGRPDRLHLRVVGFIDPTSLARPRPPRTQGQ